MTNGSGKMTATDQYKIFGTIDGHMIEIVGIGAENITVTGMIAIIPPTKIGGMTNEENMQIQIGVTQIGGEICGETSVRNRLETINRSPIET